jgi:glutamate formiminotransferase/formiminotetrahydrofolate cyclodeaminase
MKAMKLPKEPEAKAAERQAAITAATLGAARSPLAVARMAVQALQLALQAAQLGNTNAISDAGTAAAMAQAALQGAALNVRINVHSLGESSEGAALIVELKELEKKAAQMQTQITVQIQERGGFVSS